MAIPQRHGAAGLPAYLYFYERTPPSDSQTIGASHALELNHIFGGLIPFWPQDARDDELKAQMQRYWAVFARTGNPNHQDLPQWEQFNDLAPQEMNFGHDQTAARRVEREERYRAMQAQFETRLVRAAQVTEGGGD